MKAARRSFISWTLGTRGLQKATKGLAVTSLQTGSPCAQATHEWMSLWWWGRKEVSSVSRRGGVRERARETKLTRDPGR